jgi:germination protein M
VKKRKTFGLILLFLVICMAGCGKSHQEKEAEGYKVYYVNASGLRLVETSYEPSAQTFEEMMDELMGALSAAPSGYTSALAGNTKYLGYERGIDALRVDFSEEYYSLTNIEAVLLQAAVVKTLCQVPGVTKVMITVGSEQATDPEGEPIPAMDANDFIDTKEGGINSYLYATLSLYFADADGDALSCETRNLHYSSNMVLERVVVEQLIQGPETSGLKALFTKNVKIQNLYIQDGICTINFDEEANKTPSESSPDPELVLKAVVDSICETDDDITGVKFEIDGDGDVLFRDKVSLNQVFEADSTDVVSEEMETEG